MNIVDMIYYWARAVPDRPAIIQPEMVTTFAGLADAIESVGERIERLNLSKREPVAVCLVNPSFMLATVFALMRGGYSVAPVYAQLYPHLADAGIHHLIYDVQGLVTSRGRNIRFDLSWLPRSDEQAAKRSYRPRPGTNVDCIFFTSGTTGVPKKVVQSAAALDRLLQYPFTCASGDHQKILVIPGLGSTFGFNRVCEILNIGKTACFAQGSEAMLSLIDLFGIEVVIASAAQALALAEAKRQSAAYRLNSLKTVIVAAGSLEPHAVSDIAALLCRNVLNQYGATEAGVVALAPFSAVADVPGAIGFLLPWTDLQIVDERDAVLQPGSEGFIRYRTPQLIENIKASGAEGVPGVRDGWFYPGDVGSVTPEGVLRVVGRSSDVINAGGVKVSARRIEQILRSRPEIKDAAACGLIGQSGLEEIWIAIVADDSVDLEAINSLLRNHQDVMIAPNQIFIVDQLPRGELGKLQNYRLKELLLGLKRGA